MSYDSMPDAGPRAHLESPERQVDSCVNLHEAPSRSVEDSWRKFLSRTKLPSHYIAPEYFLEPFFAHKNPFAIVAFRNGEIAGVLTGLHEGTATACGMPNRPQICIAEDTDPSVVACTLARGLLEEGRSSKSVTLFSGNQYESFERYGFRRRPFVGNVVLDLLRGPSVLFKQFHENRRRNIRAALRNGVEVFKAPSQSDIESYYQVYLEWHKTPRKQITGEKLSLEVFLQAFQLSGNRCAFLASHAGKIIAGITLRMYSGGVVEFSAASAIEDYLHLRPHDLLHWRAIEWACREGYAQYSLGAADSFHRRFGGTVAPIYRYRLDKTLLRRLDLRDAVEDRARAFSCRLPSEFKSGIRSLVSSTLRR